MNRCPYCGEKIATDAVDCDHCGKTLRKSGSGSKESSGLTNLDSWKEKSVPAWVMYAVVGATLFCVILMIAQGCEKFNSRQPRDLGALHLNNQQQLTISHADFPNVFQSVIQVGRLHADLSTAPITFT